MVFPLQKNFLFNCRKFLRKTVSARADPLSGCAERLATPKPAIAKSIFLYPYVHGKWMGKLTGQKEIKKNGKKIYRAIKKLIIIIFLHAMLEIVKNCAIFHKALCYSKKLQRE